MIRKRLTRERKWGFQNYPYHQTRIESDIFTGWAALIYLTDGENVYWDFKKAGKVPVAGEGMCWLTLLPDNRHRAITAKFTKERNVSCWYIDVIEDVIVHEDGVLGFVDKYLDVVATTAGDVTVVDQDELDDAYQSGELSTEQYEAAIEEGKSIVRELCTDLNATEEWCTEILHMVEEKVQTNFTLFLDVDDVLNVYHPDDCFQNIIPEALDLFAGLVKRTRAKVVVISDWRFGSDGYVTGKEQQRSNWKNLVNVLEGKNVPVADMISFGCCDCLRADEITAYLNCHQEIRNYAVLDACVADDYSSDSEVKKHLVLVDAQKGLQSEDAVKTCEIMNRITNPPLLLFQG